MTSTDPHTQAEYTLLVSAIAAARKAGYQEGAPESEESLQAEHLRRVDRQGKAYASLKPMFPTIELGDNEGLRLLGTNWDVSTLDGDRVGLWDHKTLELVYDLPSLGMWFLDTQASLGVTTPRS